MANNLQSKARRVQQLEELLEAINVAMDHVRADSVQSERQIATAIQQANKLQETIPFRIRQLLIIAAETWDKSPKVSFRTLFAAWCSVVNLLAGSL